MPLDCTRRISCTTECFGVGAVGSDGNSTLARSCSSVTRLLLLLRLLPAHAAVFCVVRGVGKVIPVGELSRDEMGELRFLDVEAAADATRSQTPAFDFPVVRVPPDRVLPLLITSTREDVPWPSDLLLCPPVDVSVGKSCCYKGVIVPIMLLMELTAACTLRQALATSHFFSSLSIKLSTPLSILDVDCTSLSHKSVISFTKVSTSILLSRYAVVNALNFSTLASLPSMSLAFCKNAVWSDFVFGSTVVVEPFVAAAAVLELPSCCQLSAEEREPNPAGFRIGLPLVVGGARTACVVPEGCDEGPMLGNS